MPFMITIKVAWRNWFHDSRLDSLTTTTWVLTHTKALEILDRLQGSVCGPWKSNHFTSLPGPTFTSSFFRIGPDNSSRNGLHYIGQTRAQTITIVEGESNVQCTSLSGFDGPCLMPELQNFKAYLFIFFSNVDYLVLLFYDISMCFSHLGAGWRKSRRVWACHEVPHAFANSLHRDTFVALCIWLKKDAWQMRRSVSFALRKPFLDTELWSKPDFTAWCVGKVPAFQPSSFFAEWGTTSSRGFDLVSLVKG